MGSGKSSIGSRLSEIKEMNFLDTDVWIEEKEGRTISQIFEENGETYFRDLETKCLQILLKDTTNTVISVGGGLPVKEENRKLLQQLGTVIYLKAKADTIYARLKGDTTRPLLQTDNPMQKIKDMMADREEKYQAAAHHVLTVDMKSITELVEEIVDREENKHENIGNKRSKSEFFGNS